MSHQHVGANADLLTGEFDLYSIAYTVNLLNVAGQRINIQWEYGPGAFTTDGTTVPVIGGAGTQVPVTGAGDGCVATGVVLPVNCPLQIIGAARSGSFYGLRTGRFWISRAP